MRKLLLSLIIVLGLLPSVTLAQKKTVEHLKFLGIPICGTVENFGKQLEEKGYTKIEGTDFYSGFWDGDSVDVHLTSNEKIDMVYSVNIFAVNAPVQDKHKLEHLFNSYVKRFEIKYDSESETHNDSKFIPIYKNKILIGYIAVCYFELDDTISIVVRYIDNDGLERNREVNDKDL